MRIDANKCIGLVEELLFEADHNQLHIVARAVQNVLDDLRIAALDFKLSMIAHLADVGVVEGGVDLVEHKKWRWVAGVDGEEKCESSDRLLATTQIVHRSKAFAGCNAIEIDSVKVGLFLVDGAEEGLCTLILRQFLQNKAVSQFTFTNMLFL